MQKGEIKPGEAYAVREKRSPESPLQPVRIVLQPEVMPSPSYR